MYFAHEIPLLVDALTLMSARIENLTLKGPFPPSRIGRHGCSSGQVELAVWIVIVLIKIEHVHLPQMLRTRLSATAV
jgi:hypothetical protein